MWGAEMPKKCKNIIYMKKQKIVKKIIYSNIYNVHVLYGKDEERSKKSS
jgi:hypothetical protein